jgi:hypothetical protein
VWAGVGIFEEWLIMRGGGGRRGREAPAKGGKLSPTSAQNEGGVGATHARQTADTDSVFLGGE